MKCFNNRFKSCRKAQVYRVFFPSSKIWHKGKTFLGIVEQMTHFIDFSKENENRGPSFKCFHCQTQKKGSVLLIFFFFKFLYKTYFWKDFSFNFVFLKHVFSFSSHYIDFCNEFAGKASPLRTFACGLCLCTSCFSSISSPCTFYIKVFLFLNVILTSVAHL